MITYYNGEGKVMATSDGMPSGRAAPRRLFQPSEPGLFAKAIAFLKALFGRACGGGASAEAGGVRDLLGPPDG
jgi:hypothetical protein